MDYPSTMMASSNSTTSSTVMDDDPFTINGNGGNVSIPFFWPLIPSPPILLSTSDNNNNSSTIGENLDEIEFWKDIYSKNNMQPGVGWKIPQYYSLPYQVIGTIFQGIILIVGVLGNVMVVIVVLRSRSMRTPTNCYLVSLAVADTMVLLASVPNEIIAYYLLGDKWIWGPIGCALFIFLQYLGINASSLSIAAFTVERYIAICHPMLAHKLCTVRRAKRIIMYVWMFATTYCAPWLFLTKTERIHYLWVETEVYTCKFKLNREHYKGYFLTDIVLFYILPLLIACVLYALIARILYNSNDIIFHKALKNKKNTQQQHSTNVTTSSSSSTTTAKITNAPNSGSTPSHNNNNNNNFGSTSTIIKMNSEKVTGCDSKKTTSTSDSSRVQVVKMLAVVVAVFATLWLPYRALVVYNSFTFPPYMELWYLMFAKTMIFVNSAINPIIYSACSMKFRREFKRMLTCNTKGYLRNTTMASGGGGAYRNVYRMDGVTISMASTSNQPASIANDNINQNTNNKNQRFRVKKSSTNTIARSSGEEPKSSSESLLLENIDKRTNNSGSLNNKTDNNNNCNNEDDQDNVQCQTINDNKNKNSNLNLNNNNLNSNKKSTLRTTASITVYHHNDHERNFGGVVVGSGNGSGSFRTETIITSDSLNCQEHQF